MGAVTAVNDTTAIQRDFSCEAIALMGGVPSGWTVLYDTCGQYFADAFASPFASFGTGAATVTLISGTTPINVTQVGSEFTVSVDSGDLISANTAIDVSGTGHTLSDDITIEFLPGNVDLADIGGSLNLNQLSATGATNGDVVTLVGGVWTYSTPSTSSTDLTFTGASSPVTLNSSTGTDVTFTAGTGIYLSASGTNLTINSTAPSYSFTNALNESSGIVKWGGALVENTLISGAYHLNFTNSYITIGSTSTSFTASTVIAKNGTGSTLTSVALHLAGNGGDNNAKLSFGVGDAYSAGIGYFFSGGANIFRMYHMSTGYTMRWAIGSETSDKMVLMPNGNGRLGVGFSSTTGLHSTLQSGGSFAIAALNTVGAPTIDENKGWLIFTGSSPQTYTLPSASSCTGRWFPWMNHGSATITLSANVKTASGSSFNTLAPGEMAIFTSDGLDFRGKKW